MAWLIINEIRSLIKSGEFNKGEQLFRFGEAFLEKWPRQFCIETFYNHLRKFYTNAKIDKVGGNQTYLTSANIRINICIYAFSVVPWGSEKWMYIGKIRMLGGLVSTHWNDV